MGLECCLGGRTGMGGAGVGRVWLGVRWWRAGGVALLKSAVVLWCHWGAGGRGVAEVVCGSL